MANNKVQLSNGTVLIDLSNDTVTSTDDIMSGKVGHLADGTQVTGTGVGGSSGVLYITDTLDANGGTIRSINTTDGTITDTLDANGGTIRNITGAEVYLQEKSVNPTESAQNIEPDEGYDALSNVQIAAIPSDYIGSGVPQKSSSDLTVSGATVTAPAGVYGSAASKSVASGSASTPATTITANPSISVSSGGLITATASASQSITPSVSAGYVSSGTAGTITVSGSNTSQLSTQAAATITPSTSQQTAVAAGKYTTGNVVVSAMPSGTAGTPTATKGTVSNHAITVTPSVTNTTGYITGGTKTGTGVSVSASELVSGNLAITSNGDDIDCSNYSTVSVNVSGGGSSYTPISVGSFEVTANITSTSVTTITTSLTIDTSALISSKMIYVKIRDKAGKRNGYFFGTDMFYPIWDGPAGGTTLSPAKQVYRINSGGGVGAYTPAGTTCYGVYVSGITELGEVYVMGRYSSSYSSTIDGTYSIDIYMLEWPDDVSPMV